MTLANIGMPRKPSLALGTADMEQFLSSESDFALEMAALQTLRSLDFDGEHAAVYVDPITNKMRAYDIRARMITGSRSVRLAVECKNVRPSSPLLVHATPRREKEAYHSVVKQYHVGGAAFQSTISRANVYHAGDYVGRQTDQPTKDDSGNFKFSDGPTYEKWLQAVNGCLDLLRELVDAKFSETKFGVIVPILVVPSGTLWQVDYDDAGVVVNAVRQVERTTLILRHRWSAQTHYAVVTYNISHLEIITLPALRQRVKNLIQAGGLLSDLEQ